MSYQYVFHSAVKDDYEAAYQWYEERQEGLGKRFLSAVRSKMEQVRKKPESYSERSKKGYREATVEGFPFSIVYTIYRQKKEIFVSSIYHHKRNPKHRNRKTK